MEAPGLRRFGVLRKIRDGSVSFDDARIFCQACHERGECQLGISLRRNDRINGVSGTVTLPRHCEGGPGVAHGGMVLAVLEEAIGSVHTSSGLLAVTVTMEAAFLGPVPVMRPLRLWGSLMDTHDDGRRRIAHAAIESERVLATAVGKSKVREPNQHFSPAVERNSPTDL